MTAASVAEVLALFDRWGGETYDEDISQRDHALQAARLAVEEDAPAHLVAAALLHDVGHLLDLAGGRRGDGVDLRHEDAGAAWLRPLFPATVTAPIALHVKAKRYLVAVDPRYRSSLSDASVRSLAAQGGPMSSAEVEAFRAARGATEAVRLRQWDDRAKVEGLAVPALARYTNLLEQLLSTATGGRRSKEGEPS